MENFRVQIDFIADVSEDAAAVLEDLVEEFVQRASNVVVNDAIDQIALNMNPPELTPSNVVEFRDYKTMAEAFDDEGSDAPISAVNFEDDGATDFDRR